MRKRKLICQLRRLAAGYFWNGAAMLLCLAGTGASAEAEDSHAGPDSAVRRRIVLSDSWLNKQLHTNKRDLAALVREVEAVLNITKVMS